MLRTFSQLKPLLLCFRKQARRPSIRYSSVKFQANCSIFATKMENDSSKKTEISALNPNSQPRGALVVLEGLDRSGKSSQCSELLSHLQSIGCPVELWRFPDRNTAVGQMISAYLSNESNLDDHTIHLLFSANRWEKRSLMEDKLKAGTTLIIDRYSYSGVAFSSAKGLDFDWCKAPEMGLLAPDMVLYLDISPEKAAERGGYGDERYERVDFQGKVREKYQALHDASWKIVDACLPMEEVQKKLREYVVECVATCQNGRALSHLWSH
ncbi:thymidylate kinase [Spinacia oleracea]|uniref:Thymidylate kinase n=1 Tax=Spinacia oleracea TaxID=3562 RepID=A0A9R0JCT3_SPIOL|nr:thymidylate kinase [Spinacia oleracea]